VKDVVLDEQASSVPWTIVNKYYTADVEFLVHPLSSWESISNTLFAPALLFVWNRGEPYRDHIRKISQHASQHEFEVALAIRLPPTGSTLPVEIEDDQDIDAYLASKGFEFIDVPDIEPHLPDRTGILGIPRVVDALSTIMWPSMVQQTSKRVTTTGFVGTAQEDLGVSSDDYRNLVRLVGQKISGNDGDYMQRELEELERWLDEDTLSGDPDARSADSQDDAIPWSTTVTPGTLSPSLSGFLPSSHPATPDAGFDDDFTSFVSASPETEAGIPPTSSHSSSSLPGFTSLVSTSFSSTFGFDSASSGRSTPIFDEQFDTSRLAPQEAYTSLGSVSDHGDLDKGPVYLERSFTSGDGESEDMPTRAEIEQTSLKIFGHMPSSLSSTHERGKQPQAVLGDTQSQGCPAEEVDVEMTDVDLERFDLQNVLGVLQGLKEEIAGMPDKDRRKAAARVALGLAYGFGSDLHPEVTDQ